MKVTIDYRQVRYWQSFTKGATPGSLRSNIVKRIWHFLKFWFRNTECVEDYSFNLKDK